LARRSFASGTVHINLSSPCGYSRPKKREMAQEIKPHLTSKMQTRAEILKYLQSVRLADFPPAEYMCAHITGSHELSGSRGDWAPSGGGLLTSQHPRYVLTRARTHTHHVYSQEYSPATAIHNPAFLVLERTHPKGLLSKERGGQVIPGERELGQCECECERDTECGRAMVNGALFAIRSETDRAWPTPPHIFLT
jgi:hypothetical protein